MLIQIRNWKTDKVIFELDKEGNTFKDTVEEAVRRGVNLSHADFSCATLKGADLHGAKLYNASFANANLEGANLRCADLTFANIIGANLSCADLTGAEIKYCNFGISTSLTDTIMPDFPLACPEKGSFIAYKGVVKTVEYDMEAEFIVKLEIPEYAKRSSATSNKCRCSKAKVLEIKDVKNGRTVDEITNTNMLRCIYKVGEMVYPDFFDECRWHECSNGIHFFMTEEEVSLYCMLTR